MPGILANDLKLVKTQVMTDDPEGGGSPTAVEVVDGRSNEIFPDVSEVARAGGRVNLRMLALWVDTANVDTYLDGNIIVAAPPNDPNISVTLFPAADFFERRAAAISRLEAYLSIGVQYPAYLFGDHIAGQDTILLYQRTNELPVIGQTLTLTKREGYGDQFRQYVRVIDASATERDYEDDRGLYSRWIVELKLANTLAQDFPGFEMARLEYTKPQIALRTKVSDSVVANAARYKGVSKLIEAAGIGDFTIRVDSIFSQLVPSAQIETVIADVRTNLLKVGIVSSGAPVVQTINATWSTTQNLFIGGPIAPGSLSVTSGAITVTDSGGRLMSGGAQVGTADYENGLGILSSDLIGTGGHAFSVVFTPAAAPQGVNQSQGFEVKIESRTQGFVRTIEPAPLRGTLELHYMAQGRWYVLREQGDGAIRGADSSYGSGMLNFTTGTVSATLGALPDVGSWIILMWTRPDAARASDVLELDNNGNLYWPFNSSGLASLEPGAKSIAPGGLSLTWLDADGVTTRTVTDNGTGGLTGYGTGSVNYARGNGRLSPTTLPPPGTPITVTLSTVAKTAATLTIAGGNGSFGVTGITPGSVCFDVTGQMRAIYLGNPVVNWGPPATYRIVDDTAGGLVLLLGDARIAVGTVNYAAGAFVLAANTVIPTAVARTALAWDNLFIRKTTWSMDMTA